MSVSRWKVMACTLGLSLGGLAICAGQSNDRLGAPNSPTTPTPAPATNAIEPPPIVLPQLPKPLLPSIAPDTLPPLQIPTPPAREIEIEIPSPVVPVHATKAVPQVIEVPDGGTVGRYPIAGPEKLPMPREMTDPGLPRVESPLVITPPAPQVDDFTPPAPPQISRPEKVPTLTPPARVDTPPVRTPTVDPPPVPDSAPPITRPPTPVNPPVPSDRVPPSVPPPPPLPPVDLRPAPQPPLQTPTVAASTKLKMLLRLGDGKPRFEIRTSDSVELLLKVYGEKIEMQSAPEGAKASPIAGVTAINKVRFTGPGLEGTCDQLTVLSGTGEVLLKGNVHVKTKRGKTWSEMTTEKMIYQIGASGLTAPNATSGPVRPTAYQETR